MTTSRGKCQLSMQAQIVGKQCKSTVNTQECLSMPSWFGAGGWNHRRWQPVGAVNLGWGFCTDGTAVSMVGPTTVAAAMSEVAGNRLGETPTSVPWTAADLRRCRSEQFMQIAKQTIRSTTHQGPRSTTGFVWVLKNLESAGILLWHFPGLESPGERPLVLESSGNLLNSTKKYEVYERQ